MSFLPCFYGGARQFVFIIIFLFMLNIFFNPNTKTIFKLLLFIIVLLILSHTVFSIVNKDYLVLLNGNIVGDTGRSSQYSTAWDIFMNYVLLGVGFGQYSNYADHVYPHNIFLEILSETGLVGGVLFLGTLLTFLYRFFINASIRTDKKIIYILPLCVFGIRSLVSGSMTSNIIILSYSMALFYIKDYGRG